ETLAAFGESCRRTDACNALFVADGGGGSCAGELATLDMIVDMISAHAPGAAEDICNRLLVSYPRPGNLVQPGSQQDRLRHVPELLSQAARIMAREIENPLCATRIAEDCGISVRQLERLFRKHLGVSPMQYYSSLKVERALELVSQTDLALHEIAFACGFASPAALARKFRRTFGITPSQWRDRRTTAPANAPGGRAGRPCRPVVQAAAGMFQAPATRCRNSEQEPADAR
ncbi:MAG: helix-turn-helix domain-containing protein, partial [Roseovarius sp.]|nr:helix-turn-helix domain-containing protein [Roseovarius sp.]